MRINEVININIPIRIDLDSKGDPKVTVADKDAEELDKNPVMITPQQQDIELKKAELGKKSPAIDKMLDDESIGDEEEDDQEDSVTRLKTLSGLSQ